MHRKPGGNGKTRVEPSMRRVRDEKVGVENDGDKKTEITGGGEWSRVWTQKRFPFKFQTRRGSFLPAGRAVENQKRAVKRTATVDSRRVQCGFLYWPLLNMFTTRSASRLTFEGRLPSTRPTSRTRGRIGDFNDNSKFKYYDKRDINSVYRVRKSRKIREYNVLCVILAFGRYGRPEVFHRSRCNWNNIIHRRFTQSTDNDDTIASHNSDPFAFGTDARVRPDVTTIVAMSSPKRRSKGFTGFLYGLRQESRPQTPNGNYRRRRSHAHFYGFLVTQTITILIITPVYIYVYV